MTMPVRSNMCVDNLARAQRAMLSIAEPGTPAHVERSSQGEPTPQRTQGQQPIKPHGVHLNAAVRLSKGWGPPLECGVRGCRSLLLHRNPSSRRRRGRRRFRNRTPPGPAMSRRSQERSAPHHCPYATHTVQLSAPTTPPDGLTILIISMHPRPHSRTDLRPVCSMYRTSRFWPPVAEP